TLDFMRSRTGVWDTSEYKCIRCSGKFENKICGDEIKLYASVDVDICTKAGNGKCEVACGADIKCDEKNPGDSCAFGVCDTSCNCIGPDLVITSGWDDNGIVEYTIKNQGEGDAGESYTALYIKDTTDTWVYRANDYEGPLSTGGSRGYGSSQQSFPTYTLSDRATDCAGRATMPVSVCADYYGARVDEGNEDNNCYEFPVGCDTTPPTTEIKIKHNSTDITGEWLKAGTYTIEFVDKDQTEGSGLNCENCTCEYSIYRCDIGGSSCTTSIVSLRTRDCNWSVNINAGTSPYGYQGLKRYKINSKVTDQVGNEGIDYEHLDFDFEAPTTE
ncbi:hypothetical protein KAT51_07930, partial [bacterium]|nr:hypothetical protein [bacterium]